MPTAIDGVFPSPPPRAEEVAGRTFVRADGGGAPRALL